MTKKAIENRLRRLEGQVGSLRERVAAGESCEVVVPQFLAIKGALTAAFTQYLKEALAECSSKDVHKRDTLVAMIIKE